VAGGALLILSASVPDRNKPTGWINPLSSSPVAMRKVITEDPLWGVIVDYRAERAAGVEFRPCGTDGTLTEPTQNKCGITSKKVSDLECVAGFASRGRVRGFPHSPTFKKGPRYRRDTPPYRGECSVTAL
jgi:hypothetical protein